MGREDDERLLFQSFAFVPADSFAEAADTSGSGEYYQFSVLNSLIIRKLMTAMHRSVQLVPA